MDLLGHFAPALISIIALDELDNPYPVGNAFVVRCDSDEAIVMTASHNCWHLEQLNRKNTAFNAGTALPPGFKGHIKKVIGIRLSTDMSGPNTGKVPTCEFLEFRRPAKEFDVALARVKSNDGTPFEFKHSIRLTPPPVGEYVFVLGSESQDILDQEKVASQKGAKFGLNSEYVTRNGRVIKHYDDKPGITNGPCFEASFESGPGLSGSPVFCSMGNQLFVCGLVSSSLDNYPTTIASLYPALMTTFNVGSGGKPGDENLMSVETSLFDLIRNGLVSVLPGELEHFSVIHNKSVTFKPGASKDGQLLSTVEATESSLRANQIRDEATIRGYREGLKMAIIFNQTVACKMPLSDEIHRTLNDSSLEELQVLCQRLTGEVIWPESTRTRES